VSRCPCRACSFPSLPWVALCVLCVGGIAAARCGSAPLLAVALAAWWAHALDLRGYVIGCGRAAGERAS